MDQKQTPIFVDLDGTLILGDLSTEALLQAVRKNPLILFHILFWRMRGNANVKNRLAQRAHFNPQSLAYHRPLLTYLKAKADQGCPLFLATGSDRRLAELVAEHLGIFEGVLASDGQVNLAGRKKARAIEQACRGRPFVYAGNTWSDLVVWRTASSAIAVNPPPFLTRHLSRRTPIEKIFNDRRNRATTLIQALRVHHWSKNLLIFVPLFTAHQFTDFLRLAHTARAFLAFCLICSAGYLINDLFDLNADRQHHIKRRRPLASGRMSMSTGLALVPVCLLGGLLLGFSVPAPFYSILLVYLVGTITYSLALKRWPLIDVLALAGLFTVRVFSGGFAAQVPISQWLIAFSGFLFVSLALLKRYAELRNLQDQDKKTPPGRGYSVADLDLLAGTGMATGCTAVLILALYINSPQTSALYARPDMLWLFCPLFFYWIFRMWLMGRRGLMSEDPIIFATRDGPSWMVGILVIATVLLAK